MIKEIGFVGMGLMGGSIAKSIKKYRLADKIIAYNRNPQNLQPALDEGIVDARALDVGESFAHCDIIFLCCPVHINIQMAKQLAPFIKKTCILTDVGSTKSDIHDAMAKDAPDICFIGGHPMTGSEKTGYGATSAQLFENITYVLAPSQASDDIALDTMTSLVRGIKSIPIVIEPTRHDQATAAISHMPHLLSVALVNAVKDMDTTNGYMQVLAAGGFRDMTRIAAASADMWAPIFQANKKPLLQAVERVEAEIQRMKTIVAADDLDAIYDTFKSSKDYRDGLSMSKHGLLPEEFSFTVDVDDTPGIIAKIATILYEADMNIKNIGIINNRERDEGVLEIHFEDEAHMNESARLLEQMAYMVHVKL